jgi:hypothetical protein
MAYTLEQREQAFILYAQGLSYDDVAAEMRQKNKKECGKIKRQTISKWGLKYAWERRKKRVQKEVETQVDQTIVNDKLEVIGKLKIIRNDILDDVQRLAFKSKEGAIYSLRTILKELGEMTGERGRYGFRGSIDRLVMIIFNVLGEDTRIAPILKERENYILQQIEARIQDQEAKPVNGNQFAVDSVQ